MSVVEQSQCDRSSEFGALATTGPATATQLGLRHDAGDATDTGIGVELGGRVSYTDLDRGLSLEVASGRALVAHEDSKYREWGASGAVRFAPGERERGLSFSLAPPYWAAWSGVEVCLAVGVGQAQQPQAGAIRLLGVTPGEDDDPVHDGTTSERCGAGVVNPVAALSPVGVSRAERNQTKGRSKTMPPQPLG